MKHETAFEREVWGEPIQNKPSGLIPARRLISGTEVDLEPLDPAAHGAARGAALAAIATGSDLGAVMNATFKGAKNAED